jgi:hypothetical protein
MSMTFTVKYTYKNSEYGNQVIIIILIHSVHGQRLTPVSSDGRDEILGKVKGKIVSACPIKAYKERKSIAPLILNPGTRGR